MEIDNHVAKFFKQKPISITQTVLSAVRIQGRVKEEASKFLAP